MGNKRNKMLQLVSALCVTVISLQVACAKPTVSVQNEGNGNFGFNYEVSHKPGSSNVHLNFGGGGNKRHEARYHADSKTAQFGKSLPHERNFHGNAPQSNYQAEAGIKPFGNSESLIYEPSSDEGSFQSPYDSVNKHTGNGYNNPNVIDESHNPKFQQSHPSYLYSDPEKSGSSYGSTQHQYQGSSVPVKNIANNGPYTPSHYSQPAIESSPYSHPASVGQSPYSSPLSQHDVDVPLGSSDPHYVSGGSHTSLSPQQSIDLSSEPYSSVHAEQVSHPSHLSRQDLSGPLHASDPNYAVKGSQHQPISQHDIDADISLPSSGLHDAQPLVVLPPTPAQHTIGNPNHAEEGLYPQPILQQNVDVPLQYDPNYSLKSPPLSQQDVDVPLHTSVPSYIVKESLSPPLSQKNVDVILQSDPSYSVKSPPVSQQDLHVPLHSSDPSYSVKGSAPPNLSHQNVVVPVQITDPSYSVKTSPFSPVSQQDVNVPLHSSNPSYAIKGSPPQPVLQQNVDVPLQSDSSYSVKSPLSKQNVAVPLHSSDPSYSVKGSVPPTISHQSVLVPIQTSDPSYSVKTSPLSPVSQHDVDVPLHSSNPSYLVKESLPQSLSQQNLDVPIQSDPSYTIKSTPLIQQDVDVPLHPSNPSYSVKGAAPPTISHQNVVVPVQIPDPSYSVKTFPLSPASQHDIDVPLHSPDPSYTVKGYQPLHHSQKNSDIPVPNSDPSYTVKTSPFSPVPQHDVDVPPHSSNPSYSVKGSAPHPLSQQNVDVLLQSPEPSYSVKTSLPSDVPHPLSNSNYGVKGSLPQSFPPQNTEGNHPRDSFQSAPAGPKYVIVPSGPAYTKDSFTTEIIHASPHGNVNVPQTNSLPSYNANENSAHISEHPPVSHAFRLPSPSPYSSGPESINSEKLSYSSQQENSDGIAPTSPISHSTRLLIPSPLVSQSSGSLKPISEPFPAYPGSIDENSSPLPDHSTGLDPSKSASYHGDSSPEIPPISHSFRLNIPVLTPGVLPDLPDTKPEDNIVPHVPITTNKETIGSVSHPPHATHAFRLVLPNTVPGVLPELPQTHGDLINGGSAETNSDFAPPVSHAVRLSWPPTPPDHHTSVTPEVDYPGHKYSNINNFKSSDLPLIALETEESNK